RPPRFFHKRVSRDLFFTENFQCSENTPGLCATGQARMNASTTINTLQLLGLGGANKVMAGELSRLCRRAFTQERSKALLEKPPQKAGPGGLVYPFAPDLAALSVTYHRTSARVLWGLYQSYANRLEP